MRGTLTATATVGAVVLVYVLFCWVRPFAPCWCCKGDGRHYRPDRRKFRRCRWCRETGRRLRVGRRVWNYARRLRHEAS
jgi:hypothetical protein